MFRVFIGNGAIPAPILAALLLAACAHRPPEPAPLARLGEGVSRREVGVQSLPPGAEVELAAMQGPGVIRHLWITCLSDNPRVYAGLILRAWWDGEAEPSIESPLSDLFGVGFGEERLVRSAAVEMIPAGLPGHAALTCWLPMPFEAARITIENQWGEEVPSFFHQINWEQVPDLDNDIGRLHAQWRRSNPVERGRHHTALQAEGEGHFVGLVYSIRRLSGGAWVEGGEDFHIDVTPDEWRALETWDGLHLPEALRVPPDARSVANQPMGPVWPTLPGIGGEDYFSQSWGFRAEDRSLFHGVSLGPEDEDRMTAYRFHLLDPIRFHENLWMIFRNHGWDVGPRTDDITTLALWYQREPHLGFPTLPPLGERLPDQE